jgi:hypothetical protein
MFYSRRNIRLLPLLVVAGALILLPGDATAKPWHGIVPLHSTRADVERILGKPVVDRDVYDAPDGRAIISYSKGLPCEEGVPGLGNIPGDTVVEIYLSLTRFEKLSDRLAPGREYTQIQAVHTPTLYYVDRQEGVRYTVQDGMVVSISYGGSTEDEKKFSCGEYKYAAPLPENPDPRRIEQYPYDSYGKIRFEDAKARLDNFVIQLLQSNEKSRDYRGFIIVYAGRSAHAHEAQTVANCSKNYLVKVRQADPETIVAVDGGYQDKFTVELYIYPIKAYPPMLLPTVSPKKVHIVKGRCKSCS